jgi:glutaredoxin
VKVTLYTREECGLCYDAEDILRRLKRDIRFELSLVDVDKDVDACERYSDRVPVIVVDGEEVDAAHLDERRLKALLAP